MRWTIMNKNIFWHKNTLCRHINDISDHTINYVGGTVHRKLVGSYRFPVKYGHYARDKWQEIKMCSHLDDSRRLAGKQVSFLTICEIYVCTQINWRENKICHLTDDSCRSPSKYIHYIGSGNDTAHTAT